MGWTELKGRRTETNRIYRDTVNPRKQYCSARMAPLHYASVPGSGVYDTEINATPYRINNAVTDGWRIVENGWHYFVGKDLANHGDEDGWVGFGGRRGAHWFKFRIGGIGYLHWPTRSWDGLGGAPTYDRANLSRATHAVTVGPEEEEVNVWCAARWGSLWTTPGGGQVDVTWNVTGERLKEEIVVNREAREYLAANLPPLTPASETWFGFMIEVDWSDVPKRVRDGIELSMYDDFADDGKGIELRTALDELLAFMPLDDVRVIDSETLEVTALPLRKRFWRAGGKNYLLVGVRWDSLGGLPAGDLIFDPTLNLQVGASADDGYYVVETTTTSVTGNEVYLNHNSTSRNGLWRWSVAIGQGAAISDAEWGGYMPNALYDHIDCDVYFQDVDNAPDLNDAEVVTDRARTTATHDWDVPDWPNQYPYLDVTAMVQEIVDRPGWESGNYMAMMTIDTGNIAGFVQSYDSQPTGAATLDIEYEEAAGGDRRLMVMGVK